MIVVGTRPEIIRLAAVMRRLDATPGVEHVLGHTGQNWDHRLNGIFFEEPGGCDLVRIGREEYNDVALLDAALSSPPDRGLAAGRHRTGVADLSNLGQERPGLGSHVVAPAPERAGSAAGVAGYDLPRLAGLVARAFSQPGGTETR